MRPRAVVIGAGSAGSVLASRLASRFDVTILEAGRRMPASRPSSAREADAITASPAWRWALPAQLTRDRSWTSSPGRVVGGSSVPSGGYYSIPADEDLRAWHRAGGDAWDSDRVRATIQQIGEEWGAHPAAQTHPIARAFAEASLATGHGTGFLLLLTVVRDGLPRSLADVYLRPGRGIDLRADSRALRIVVADGRAVGVEVAVGDGSRELIDADEVIVASGGLGTARLLLSSGIGPATDLERVGIPVAADVPGVGAAFSDHPTVWVEWMPTRALTDGRDAAAVAEGAFPAALQLAADGGPGDDLEILACTRPPQVDAGPGASRGLIVGLQRPRARGTVRATSPRPLSPAAIDYRYLEHDHDRAALRTGVRAAAALLTSRPFAPLVERLVDLDPATLADDTLLDGWIAARLGSAAHTCGTAPMGRDDDPLAVADGAGRVRGVRSLRIADTSLLPVVPSRAPGAAAPAIGAIVAAQL